MEKYLKFLQKLPSGLRSKLLRTITQIAKGDLEKLDIKPLKGREGIYRCRVGKIRIIFLKSNHENIVYEVGFRGDVY